MIFEIRKEYKFEDIERESESSPNYEYEEFGNRNVIGRCGIVLHNNAADTSYVFVMSRVGKFSTFYVCVSIM